jgi:hypothetical protein
MKRLLLLLVLALTLLCLPTSNSSVATGNCVDADNDGACAGVDCNDNAPLKNLRDDDGDTVTSCQGDCRDSDPLITNCTQFLKVEPDYTNDIDGCWDVTETIKEYRCQQGQSFSQCTLVNTTTNQWNTCTG